MTGISIVILALLTVSPAWAACSDAKLAEVRTTGARTVAIDCDLILAASDTISTRLVLLGKAATGITVDCQGAQLTSGIVIRSRSYIEDGVRKWEPVKNATIKNCNIVGVVRIWGMARLAEGLEYDGVNHFRLSSRKPGHTARARANAPSNITLENLNIRATGLIPMYFAPGVTHSRLINSELAGVTGKVAIYLDAESAFNVIRGNKIYNTTEPPWHLRITNLFRFPPGTPMIAIDGSSGNTIEGNRLSRLGHGGIYLYRNCGEGGVIRHATPSRNKIINNVFNGANARNPAVFIGSRNGRGWLPTLNDFPCRSDEGYLDAGSANSNKDYARDNIVTDNRFHTRTGLTLDDMIQSKDWEDNSPNFIGHNEVVAAETVD